MANIFTVPTSGFISFDNNAFGGTNLQPLSTAPRLSYDGLAGLTVACTTSSSNLTRFSVEGATGRLFTVTDILTGTLFTVSDSAGLPVLEVSDNDTVVMGEFDTNTLVVSGKRVGIGNVPYSTNKLSVSGGVTITGDISASGKLYGDGSFLTGIAGSNIIDSGVRALTSNFAVNSELVKYLPLSGGIVTGSTQINSNLTVYGNISATGNSYFANTFYSTTSALSVVNIGNTGPALYVANNGTGDIASFYDLDQNIEIFHIAGNNGTFPNVGVKTSTPNVDFTVNGQISSNNIITSLGGNSTNWNSVYTNVNTNSANYILDNGNTKGSNLLIGTNDNFNLALETNGSPRITILNSGNVGISTNTPNERLTVNGNISASGFLYGNGSNLTGITTSTIDSGVRSLTGNYNSVFSTVSANSARWVLEDFIVACSDESTNLTTTTSAVTFRVPFAMFLNSVRASVNVAPVGSTIIVDVRQSGTSIFSTLLSIDANEETSTTAATPAVISNPNLTDDSKVVVSINQVGSTTAGRGLKLTFKGYRV
jgi:hypothetical protein